MTVTDETTGEQLAESLLQSVGNEGMRAATHLLGAHRGRYWLRRLMKEETELAAPTDKPVIDSRASSGPTGDASPHFRNDNSQGRISRRHIPSARHEEDAP